MVLMRISWWSDLSAQAVEHLTPESLVVLASVDDQETEVGGRVEVTAVRSERVSQGNNYLMF